jgi:nucleoside-diphosphate-sugar epimerase
VLDPLLGYLDYAERLAQDPEHSPSAVNFGPSRAGGSPSAAEVVEVVLELWGEGSWVQSATDRYPESPFLELDASLAREVLGWRQRVELQEGLRLSVEWYKKQAGSGDLRGLSLAQLEHYTELTTQ